jgi:hypothetical protein
MLFIGIAGYKRAGKDTTAKMLIEELQKFDIIATRRAFADKLKEEVAEFLSDFCPKYSTEEYLGIMHSDGQEKEQYRLLMQWWGTEGRRQMFDQMYWLDQLTEYAQKIDSQVLIIPDVRFINEINFCKEKPGLVVFVKRPGCDPSDHASEREIENYDNWDFVVDNSEDLEYIREQVVLLANVLYGYLTVDDDLVLEGVV